MWLQEVIKCNKIVILNVSSLSEALVHLKEENISRGAGTMKMKMMQIIKENHLPPRLPDKADPGCCSPTFTINLINFLLNECNGLSNRIALGVRSITSKKDVGSIGLLLLIFCDFEQRVYVLIQTQQVPFSGVNSSISCHSSISKCLCEHSVLNSPEAMEILKLDLTSEAAGSGEEACHLLVLSALPQTRRQSVGSYSLLETLGPARLSEANIPSYLHRSA